MGEIKGIHVITWCQPADPRSADFVVVDGRVIEEADTASRESAVSLINSAARKGTRASLPDRGWRVDSRQGTVAQIPFDSDDAFVAPSVAIFMSDLAAPTIGRATEQVVQTAELAGYNVAPEKVEEALRYEPPHAGLFSRFIRWLLSLLGLGGKR